MLAFSNDYYGMIFRATQSVELFCAYLKQNRNVTLNTIEMLCKILQVPIEKVVRIIYDDTDLGE